MCVTYCKINKVISCSTKGCSGGSGVQWYICLLWVRGRLYSSAWETEHTLKRCILQLEALLLLQETAAQAGRSSQECGQSLNGFIALVGSYSGLFLSPWQPSFNSILFNIKPPCRNRSSVCSREIAVQGHEMACNSFFAEFIGLGLAMRVVGWFPPPPSSNCSQMDASWMLNDSTLRNHR